MAGLSVDPHQVEKAARRLGDVVLDPAAWPQVMEEICSAARATGALLLQSDVRTSDVPRTSGVAELVDDYFKYGWHKRDVRARFGVPALRRGEQVVTEQDLFTPAQMTREPFYNEFLAPRGFAWFAGIGCWAGEALWALCLQRTPQEGQFEPDEKRILATLSPRLTEVATLSAAVRRSVISAMTRALDLVQQPAVAVDRLGCVLDANAAAERIFDQEIGVRSRRLVLRDKNASAELSTLLDKVRGALERSPLASQPIIIRRRKKGAVILRAVPVSAAARGPLLGAQALLLLSEVAEPRRPQAEALARAFNLTPAEATIAAAIVGGSSLENAARQTGVAPQTARNQLKSVFKKSGMHRQAELVAAVSRLSIILPDG